jgi:hypothetical protein
MKLFNHQLSVAALVLALFWIRPLSAAPAAPAPVVASHSTFIIPTSAKEGRDPFYPESSRPYTLPTEHSQRVEMSALTLKGFSGSPEHRLAIINNHTFAVGDEGDVATSIGHLHLRCIEIKTRSVVIEADGHRFELTFNNK